MKRTIFFVFACAAIFASAALLTVCSAGRRDAVIVLQNKVEIDAQLKAFAQKFQEEKGIEVVVKSCGGDACAIITQIKADFNAGEAPDIFPIEGMTSYNIWKNYITDLSSEPWVSDTGVAFSVDGVVYGFPIAIEGWGMAYNAELLEKAGVDPKTLTNYDAYKKAFERIDSMKEDLGIDSVVSMVASSGMEWVTTNHNFNSYLANGLERDDLSVVDLALDGKIIDERMEEYADWIQLIFDYSERSILITGDYDAQVGAFAKQRAVFLHQGNWVEPNLGSANATFRRGFAPHGSMKEHTDGIFVSAPSWYVVNKDGNVDEAKEFLRYMAASKNGHEYVVNEILAVPAFRSVKLRPKAPLSASILEWAEAGKTYAWNQYYLPDAFRNKQLGPIYHQLAKGEITKSGFVDLMRKEMKALRK